MTEHELVTCPVCRKIGIILGYDRCPFCDGRCMVPLHIAVEYRLIRPTIRTTPELQEVWREFRSKVDTALLELTHGPEFEECQ